MMYSDTTRLGRPYAKDPSVIRFDGRYLLYYSLPPGEAGIVDPLRKVWGIGIAESGDLLSWRRIGEIVPEQPIEQNGICAPAAWVEGETVHLFYQTYGNGPCDALCHATSRDGHGFLRDASNPIYHPSKEWTSGRAIDAEVFPVGDKLFLYYATRDPGMKIQMIGMAEADLGSGYHRDAWRPANPDGALLRPELPWEQECIEAPTICRHGDLFYMFYAGAYNNCPQQIGCAVSPDGRRWKRLGSEPILPNGPPGAWNHSESGHPAAFVDEAGQTWLFFQGNADRGTTWFISCVKVAWTGNIPSIETRLP